MFSFKKNKPRGSQGFLQHHSYQSQCCDKGPLVLCDVSMTHAVSRWKRNKWPVGLGQSVIMLLEAVATIFNTPLESSHARPQDPGPAPCPPNTRCSGHCPLPFIINPLWGTCGLVWSFQDQPPSPIIRNLPSCRGRG